MAISRLVFAALLLAFIASAIGHSYVTSPTSRSNQKETQTGCRGPNCLGPCDVPKGQARTPAVTISRGASINVKWPRNNHAGGFIRFAWTQTDGSDVHANFDAGVQQINCHEVGGCKANNPENNPNGGDTDGTSGDVNPCRTTITVPLHLTDGKWTLQWAWFGGAFALGDYYSCIDYVIAGGASGPKKDAVFIGGDATYPGQNKCKFFNTDRLHQCVNEPCNSPIYALNQERSGPAYLPSNNNNVPTPTPTPTPITSGAKVVESLTTGAKVVSVTSGKVVTPTPTPTPNPGNANCAGLTNVATQTVATISSVDTWSNVFRMVIQINANENLENWMLQIIWPADATNTEVNSVFNAGQLKCSAKSPVHHDMISPVNWARNIKKGETMTVEIIADNTNMAASFIKANTAIKVFKP